MRHWQRTVSILAIFAAASTPSAVNAGSAGEAGALFLRIGMSARASGMGEAFIGVAEDASTVYWNPAAMAPVLGTNVLVMHNEYFQSLRLEQAAVTHETDYGTFGLSFTGLYLDKLERRWETPTEVPDGEFAVYDISFALAYARYLAPNLTAGVSVKSIYQRIDVSTAYGLAFDVGVYHVARMKGVKFAAVVTNLGAPMKFEEAAFALPRTLKVGASYQRELPGLDGDLLAAFDVIFPNDGDLRQHVGVEYGYDHRFFARAGYKAGYDTHGATFGFGIRHQQFSADYAVMLERNDLGDSHRFGLGLNL